MGYSKKDRGILRELGKQIAGIGALPVNGQRKELCNRVNDLEKAKPTVHIYEIPWHEMDVNDELKLRTKDPFCQGIERDLRRTLYKWRHMQGDMVVEPEIVQPFFVTHWITEPSEGENAVKTNIISHRKANRYFSRTIDRWRRLFQLKPIDCSFLFVELQP